MARRGRIASGVAALVLAASALVACTPAATTGTAEVVRVPADAGLILIAPGTYTETLDVRGDDVTVRGEDRNTVIIDGEMTRSSGVIGTGERITVENLTVRNFLQNGVLITGVTDDNGAGIARGPDGYIPEDVPDSVPGYLVQSVTAQNNGLYGIYAFNRTGGVIRDNLATGGSDSGIYVGQCADCAALVQDNVVTLNAVGFELANASNVVLTGNRIVQNRIGISVLSNYLEAHGPTRGVQIIGNVIDDNNAVDTPEQAGGAFGIGVGLGGTVDAVVRADRITGNENAGVWITSSEDFAPTGSVIEGNVFDGVAVINSAPAVAPASHTCLVLDAGTLTLPAELATAACDGPTPSASYQQPDVPTGISFAKVARTPERTGLDSLPDGPRTIENTVTLPDLAGVAVPDAGLLADAQ